MSDKNDLNPNDIINKIYEKKGENISLLGENFLSNIHNKIMKKIQRIEDQMPNQESPKFNSLANAVIEADMSLRKNITELAESLLQLNDKEIAKKLLNEHISILREVLKEFK